MTWADKVLLLTSGFAVGASFGLYVMYKMNPADNWLKGYKAGFRAADDLHQSIGLVRPANHPMNQALQTVEAIQ